MKNLLFIFLILGILSCKNKSENSSKTEEITSIQNADYEDNQELIDIYTNDQADRRVENIDWSVVSENDRKREKRIYELLEAGEVRTSKDYHNAAMIFQHGGNSEAYGMAVKLMTKSIELDPTADKWLLAAATDRYLLSKNEPQIYGTQFHKNNADDPWEMSEMDTTKITDEQRREYRVETLAEQKEKLRRMNLKKLSKKLEELNSIDKLIDFIKNENLAESEYDVSENGINSYGYNVMGQGDDQSALKIFKLNTELFPNAYNTHDSYGECLLKLGDKENSLKAYKKSVELNPNNEGAKKVIADLEKLIQS